MLKFISVLVVAIAISLVYLPSFWVSLAVLVDFYTPWILFESPLYDKYHNFLIDRLPERQEIPLLEITPEEATLENIAKLSKGFTWPIVVRGLLKDSAGIENWSSGKWWMDNYANESVLCGTLSEVVEDCTISTFFKELEAGKPFYISGASNIFDNNAELHGMIDSQAIRDIEPGERTATQIFMGVPDMGSDIHCALGINVFRQIVGQKKWWFIPPTQTAYLKPSWNVNGFSAHTHTLVGKQGAEPSPWLTKLERYTITLNPGDILFNPPWFWHGIINLGESNDLIIGAPSRYGKGYSVKAAFFSNPLFTLNAFITLGRKYGLKALKPGFKINLQGDIANNRRGREKKDLVEELHPFDEPE